MGLMVVRLSLSVPAAPCVVIARFVVAKANVATLKPLATVVYMIMNIQLRQSQDHMHRY